MDIRTSKHARWGVVGEKRVELTLGGQCVFSKTRSDALAQAL